MNPSSGHVIDTSIIGFYLRGEALVVQKLDALNQIYISSITLGELFYGAYRSTNVSQAIHEVEQIEQRCSILFVDYLTPRFYGNMKMQQQRKGMMLPENDLWIAAVAQQNDLILIARDHHFTLIDNLKQEQW